MKKLHVHISVKDLAGSTKFYRELFGAEPDKLKAEYVKWDLSNPPLNFAISQGGELGLNHLGMEAEDARELDELSSRISTTEAEIDRQGESVCCYARSVKTWIEDPQGVSWELFQTLNDEEIYRDNTSAECCATQDCAC